MVTSMGQMRGFIPQGLKYVLPMAVFAVGTAYTSTSQAGATFKIDDTKWVSVGAGLRTSFTAVENAVNGDGFSNDFAIDNMRLYLNAQIFKNIKLEFNTECQTCGNGGEVRVLDAIGKFEFHPMFNIWAGRLLVPAERRELNGPFYSAVYNIFGAGTPFEPSDFNILFKKDGTSAGAIGRDDGAVLWGAAIDGRLQYSFGFFQGLQGGANTDHNILFAQRIAYNFLDVEKNPGYYTSGTYYGTGGDIFTIGAANQYQSQGAGNALSPGDFRGTTVDVLFEKVLPNKGVVTFNGEYKNYGITGDYSAAARLADKANGFANAFPMFEGNAFDVSLMYLFPEKVAIGQFQPYLRYVDVMPDQSADRNVYEAGLNYIIDGHNARISLLYEYGDLLTKGLDYSSTATGDDVSAIKLGLQLQI